MQKTYMIYESELNEIKHFLDTHCVNTVDCTNSCIECRNEFWNNRRQFQWISTKDQPPSFVEDIIVLIDGNIFTGYLASNGQWQVDGFSYVRFEDVTHWMKLPIPPEEIHEQSVIDE